MQNSFSFQPIGHVVSCYKEKFGIPRQPGLVKVPAYIELLPEYSREEAFRGLQDFSHIWVVFVFHQAMRDDWKPMVRPPRLGGNDRVGVFASRSMFRPNPLGLSVVKLNSITQADKGIRLEIIGGDFVDGTPVLDIKPYLPYVDNVADAQAGYAASAPPLKLPVTFSESVQAFLGGARSLPADFKNTLSEILQYDPRPAYQSDVEDSKTYSMRLYDFDVKWRVQQGRVLVTEILAL